MFLKKYKYIKGDVFVGKKLLLIVNPKAGKGNIKRKLPRIIKNFSDDGYFIETCYTKPNYKPKEILAEYTNEKIDLVVCCGGDGTLNELINVVMKMKNKPNISFIPLRDYE
jgi:diacylglycerol kinase (ATP)